MQPCDAAHAYLRTLNDLYERTLYGFDQNPFNRVALEDSDRDNNIPIFESTFYIYTMNTYGSSGAA